MNLNLFISKKVKGSGLSSVSNAIACVSVAISIGVIIIAIAVASGFKSEIGRRAVGFSGEIMLLAPGTDYMNDTYPFNADLSYLDDIRAVEGVRNIAEVAYKPGMLKSDTDVHGALFKGVDSTYNFDFFAEHIVEGSLPDFSGNRMSDRILISKRLARMLGYGTGDNITVYFRGDDVKLRRFSIAGLYDIQLEDLDERLIIADIRQIRRLSGWQEHESSCVEIFLDGEGRRGSERQRDRIYEQTGLVIMTKDMPEDAPVAVQKVDNVFSTVFDWLALLDLNVLVVMALMIAVAGFNMISGLLIILFERISMIGLLKSLGMRTADICKVFIYRGGAIVLKGMIWGNIIAIALMLIQQYVHVVKLDPSNYFVNFVPVDLRLTDIIAVDIISFALMLLIMIIPSLFIARVSPDKTIKVS